MIHLILLYHDPEEPLAYLIQSVRTLDPLDPEDPAVPFPLNLMIQKYHFLMFRMIQIYQQI
jgi:hypothetical protein